MDRGGLGVFLPPLTKFDGISSFLSVHRRLHNGDVERQHWVSIHTLLQTTFNTNMRVDLFLLWCQRGGVRNGPATR